MSRRRQRKPRRVTVRLRLDPGLAAHVNALAKVHLAGPTRHDVLVYLIRSQVIDYMGQQAWRERVVAHLPSPYREAIADAAKTYEQLKRREAHG